MAQKTNISWCDATWNIARGCSKVDSDCKFCYMYRDSLKEKRYNPKAVTQTKDVFRAPLKWKDARKIFTSSLTDFFHVDCDSFRFEAWEIIRKCPQHTFLILTKRPERIFENLPPFWEEIKDRCWIGTSVGSAGGMQRLIQLLESGANCTYFLSAEPLHERIEIPMTKVLANGKTVAELLKWVIVGGESGNNNGLYGYRPCEIEWIESIVNACKAQNIATFVKQLGTHLAKELKIKGDRHGSNLDSIPTHLQIRNFPNE